MTKPGPIACEVPFCRRTAKADPNATGGRIICGKHWRLGDARPRLLYSRACRKLKKTGDERYARLATLAWWRVRKQAVERVGGI